MVYKILDVHEFSWGNGPSISLGSERGVWLKKCWDPLDQALYLKIKLVYSIKLNYTNDLYASLANCIFKTTPQEGECLTESVFLRAKLKYSWNLRWRDWHWGKRPSCYPFSCSHQCRISAFLSIWLLEGYYWRGRRCQKRHRNFSDEAQSLRFKTPPRPLRLLRPLKEGKILTVT